jgi:hypothetical protein
MIDSLRKAIKEGYKICFFGVRIGRIKSPKHKVYDIIGGICSCRAGVIGIECKHVQWIDFLTCREEEIERTVGEVEWS